MISKATGTGIMTMVRFLLQETHQCDHSSNLFHLAQGAKSNVTDMGNIPGW